MIIIKTDRNKKQIREKNNRGCGGVIPTLNMFMNFMNRKKLNWYKKTETKTLPREILFKAVYTPWVDTTRICKIIVSWARMFQAVGPPWSDKMRICRKYCLIPQKYNENNNNMAYGGRYLWLLGVLFCGVCGGKMGMKTST